HTARDRGLDHVRAVSHLKTNSFAHRVGSVSDSIGHVRLRSKKSVAKSGRVVEMSPGRADAVGSDEHARSNHNTFRNRIAQRNIKAVVRAIGACADIPHGSES